MLSFNSESQLHSKEKEQINLHIIISCTSNKTNDGTHATNTNTSTTIKIKIIQPLSPSRTTMTMTMTTTRMSSSATPTRTPSTPTMEDSTCAPSLDERLRGEQFVLDESSLASSIVPEDDDDDDDGDHWLHQQVQLELEMQMQMQLEDDGDSPPPVKALDIGDQQQRARASAAVEDSMLSDSQCTPTGTPTVKAPDKHKHQNAALNNSASADSNNSSFSFLLFDEEDPFVEYLVTLHRRLVAFWRNHRVTCVYLAFFVLVNLLAFFRKASIYATSGDQKQEAARAVYGSCVIVARGSSSGLNLNALLILIPVLRHVWTFILTKMLWHKQNTSTKNNNCLLYKISSWLSLLDSQWKLIHSITGWAFLYWTMVHFAAHMCNFHKFAQHPLEEELFQLYPHDIETLRDTDATQRWFFLLRQPATVSGILMLVCLLIAYAFTLLKKTLKNYQIFWYSHHLLLVVLVILMFHGREQILGPIQSVYYVLPPFVLYLLPKITREVRGRNQNKKILQVLELSVKPGHLVVLKLSKPTHWNNNNTQFTGGMYANLNIPILSQFEWHPFYMTSAPSDDYLEFHIRPIGDWTKRLYQVAKAVQSAPSLAIPPTMADIEQAGLLPPATPHSTAMTIVGDNSPTSAADWEMDPEDLNSYNGEDVSLEPKQLLFPEVPAEAMSSSIHLNNNNNNNNNGHSILPDNIESFQLKDVRVNIDGPLLSSAGCTATFISHYLSSAHASPQSHKKMVAWIGTGIRIAPMVSILKEILLKHPEKLEQMYLIWTFQNRHAMDWFASLINDILLQQEGKNDNNKKGCNNNVNIANMKNRPSLLKMRFFVLNSTKENKGTEEQENTATHSPLQVLYRKRPNWNQELTRIRLHAESVGEKKCHLFVSGPTSMNKTLCQTTSEMSKTESNFHFYCHQDSFAP
mgnify:CR=1 FL=1